MRRTAAAAALAVLALVAVSAPGAATTTRFDLAAGTVEGKPIFGRTYRAVAADLGRPQAVEQTPQTIKARYGPASAPRVEILFRRAGKRYVATSFVVADTRAMEAHLGRLLTLAPAAADRRIRARYPDTFSRIAFECITEPCPRMYEHANGRWELTVAPAGERSIVQLRRH